MARPTDLRRRKFLPQLFLVLIIYSSVSGATDESVPKGYADMMDRIEELELWREDKEAEDRVVKDSINRLDIQVRLLSKNQETNARTMHQLEERMKWLEDSTRSEADMSPQDQQLVKEFNRRMKDPSFRLLRDPAQDRRMDDMEERVNQLNDKIHEMRTSLTDEVKDGLSEIESLTGEAETISTKLKGIHDILETAGNNGQISIGDLLNGKGGGKGGGTSDGWNRLGCYAETSGRVLSYQIRKNDPQMTGERCRKLCDENGNGVAGLKNGDQCFCGEAPEIMCATAAARGTCDEPCAADSSERCGGARHLLIYKKKAYKETGWIPIGCFAKSVIPVRSTRSRNEARTIGKRMTPKLCQEKCREQNYEVAGVVRGRECYCGRAGSLTCDRMRSNQCRVPCRGDKNQICGGYVFASAYQYFS